ncbi:MAG: hypothetical protein UU48_C0027G0009, partial [Candidatus Uhrbacteria bacterium GW2011_GWF2_41_16]
LPPADISMSGKEQKEVENETFWSRQRYIEWAEDFGKDEAWVDEIFKFQPDGTTVVNGELNLRNTKIKQLPIGLMEVKGDLNVSENPSFKLNGYPKKVGGSFWCNESNLTSLQGMPKEVGRGISLEYNKIRSLYELPEKVMGDLNLAFNELKDLHGISRKVFGFLSLRENNQLTSLCLLIFPQQKFLQELKLEDMCILVLLKQTLSLMQREKGISRKLIKIMSLDSLRNPFHPPDQRTGTPFELTRHLLPSAEAQALTEALGEDEPSKLEPQQDLPPADISMSGEERKEVEKEPLWIKEDYMKHG